MENNSLKLKAFKDKFSNSVPKKLRETDSLSEEKTYQKIIFDMLKFVFPNNFFMDSKIKTNFLIKLVLGGKSKNPYKNFGGINSMYADCAISLVFNTICYYLETGYWLMGLDKADIISDIEVKTFTQYDKFHEKDIECHYIETENLIIGCTDSWYYTGILFKNFQTFEKFVNEMNKAKGVLTFENIEISCEDCEFIGNGFSSINFDALLNNKLNPVTE